MINTLYHKEYGYISLTLAEILIGLLSVGILLTSSLSLYSIDPFTLIYRVESAVNVENYYKRVLTAKWCKTPILNN